MKVPSTVTVKIVEDSASTVHLVLPPASKAGSLSDAELLKISGGQGVKTTCQNSTTGDVCL